MREVNNVVNYIKEHNTAYFDDELQEYLEKAANPQPTPTPTNEGPANANGGEYSDLFIRAIWFGVNSGTISISSIQRRFGVGFSKAGAIMDKIDRMGFVAANEPGKSNGKPRKVLLSREDCEAKFGPQPPEEYL
jgi:DNA segregation ATPase FtsK/SpoIIIE-like protein